MRELAEAHKLPGSILPVEPDDIVIGVANEWPVRHDRITVRLTGVQHEPCALGARDHAQHTAAVAVWAIEPAHLALGKGRDVVADAGGSTDDEHKAVVRRGQVLFERRLRKPA